MGLGLTNSKWSRGLQFWRCRSRFARTTRDCRFCVRISACAQRRVSKRAASSSSNSSRIANINVNTMGTQWRSWRQHTPPQRKWQKFRRLLSCTDCASAAGVLLSLAILTLFNSLPLVLLPRPQFGSSFVIPSSHLMSARHSSSQYHRSAPSTAAMDHRRAPLNRGSLQPSGVCGGKVLIVAFSSGNNQGGGVAAGLVDSAAAAAATAAAAAALSDTEDVSAPMDTH